MPESLCVICFTYADCKRCTCRGGWYCSKACQRFDWAYAADPHRDVCPLRQAKVICDDNDVPSVLRQNIFDFLGKRVGS